MRRSLRWRLQAWYGLVLLAVVGGFAAVLYYREHAAQMQELDAGLTAAAMYLDVNLRRFPPHELGALPPDRPPPPPPPDNLAEEPRRPFLRGPQRPSRERLYEELHLPPERETDARETYFAIWRADGSVLKSLDLPADVDPPALSAPPTYPRPVLTWRGACREAILSGPFHTRILVGRSAQRILEQLRAFRWQLLGAGTAFLAVGLAGGWLVSGRIFRPVAAIAATASAISATNLAERIDPDSVDRELQELACVLNATFDRLEAAFERQARFTADASHELRTPLAVLRSHAELALLRPRSAAEYRDTIETCLRAAGRMTALVEGLLTLARADAGKLDLLYEPVDLLHVVEEHLDLLRPLAASNRVHVEATLAPATVRGDAVRLGQVVTNLLSNAVQYNRVGGQVTVGLGVVSGSAVLTVADTGVGIPEADRPHLFERFYRVEKARTRAAGGNGLGLAICKSIVVAHGGSIDFTTELGRGTTFTVRLPCAPADADEV